MKSRIRALLSLVVALPLTGYAAEQLIPAGSLIQCTVSEPKLSSKTADVGDPVLCRVSHVELYGRSTLPYGSYLVGRFEDYKDPGHLVGKGWMELRFDRMVIQPDTVIPVAAKVVYVKGYNVDREGRILGKGHAVRDTLEWMVPVLWPIDLLNLPRRGPRPTLKGETRLTLKMMDDLGVPLPQQPQSDDRGLARRAPTSYQPAPVMAPRPMVQTFVQPILVPAPPPYGYVPRRYVPMYPQPYPAPYFSPPAYPPAAYNPPRYAAPKYPSSGYAPSGYAPAVPPAQTAPGRSLTAISYSPAQPSQAMLLDDAASRPTDRGDSIPIMRDGQLYRSVDR